MYMREPEASPRHLPAQFTRARRGGLAAFAGPRCMLSKNLQHPASQPHIYTRVKTDSRWNEGYLDYYRTEPNPYFLAVKTTKRQSSRGEGRAGVTEKCAPPKRRMRLNWRLSVRLNAEQN